MSNTVTVDSRSALSRARLFLEKAKACPVNDRIDFEAYTEAAIIFARMALQRVMKKHEKHPHLKTWLGSLTADPAVQFFQFQRNFIVKEAAPKIGQKVYVPPIGASQSYVPTHAKELYYFEAPHIPATDTIERYLKDCEQIVLDAEKRFSQKVGS